MIDKIKSLLDEYRKDVVQQKLLYTQLSEQIAELQWANVFHDTIRDKPWLQNLSLSPGRWAAGYNLMYILVRILQDCQPKKIVEFGLGQSSKLISLFLQYQLTDSNYTILENNASWLDNFQHHFKLNKECVVKILPLETKTFNEQNYNSYKGIEEVDGKFDLYLIDGPRGTPRYSRFDIFYLATRLQIQDDFIIIMDDLDRPGDKETYEELVKLFKQKAIPVHTAEYIGAQKIAVFTTQKYKWITSL